MFYAIGNIGDSKKTDKTRLTDKSDIYECCLEVMDVALPLSDFPTDTMMNAMGYVEDETTHEIIYTWAKDENLGILYELIDGEYVLTQDTTVDLSKTYYVDILEHDDFSEDYTYGWRYIYEGDDDEENAQVFNYCHQKWIEAYRFITTSTDEEFKAHIGDYFVVDSILYYYLFTTRYCMVDNRAKNLFFHYGKTTEVDSDGNPIRKWDLTWGYDMDTSLGLNNYGKQVYRYGLEDTDVDTKGEEIFREMDSTFFCRIRDLFPSELKAMYQTLESKNAWHAESFINKADEWQSQFPEELWRLDINRKYIRTYTESFINGAGDAQFLTNMANGKMKYQRRQWERNQEKYMASKYQSSVASSDNAVLRCAKLTSEVVVEPNYKLKIIPYAYMYLNVAYGTQSPIQIRVEPNIEYEIPYEATSADIINIYSASLIRSFGDLSICYPATVDIGKATKIKEIIIGNSTPGYDNPYLTTFTTGTNYLLETINIENVSGLNQTLNLVEMQNLREVHAFGSNIGGVTFAKGGNIRIAELPAISSISAKNLSYLEDLNIDSYINLTSATIENCPSVDVLNIINQSHNLNRVRFVGIDWTIENTDVLDRLYNLSGFDNVGHNTQKSVLTGNVYTPIVREKLLADYNAAWTDLIISYGSLINQYVATFVNHDNTTLDVQYVDVGYAAVDPITRDENPIAIPTKESTVSHNYTYAGWNSSFAPMYSNQTYMATFSEALREYTVTYMSMGSTLQTTSAPYGTYVDYVGATPTYTLGQQASQYHLFERWDKSGYVNGDKTINAVFDSCTYVDGYFNNKDLSDMRLVEIYMLTELSRLPSPPVTIDNVVSITDSFTFTTGHDFNYDDVAGQVLVDASEPKVFAGDNYFDTNICLMDTDKDFILAIDYAFASGNTSGATLAQCFADSGQNGFKLYYSSNPVIAWGTSSQTAASGTNREMLILRHVAGETGLHVYTSNLEGSTVSYVEIERDKATITDSTLIFGCKKIKNGTNFDYEGYAKGTVYWAKLWESDLGDSACKQLASYIHENITAEMHGTKLYYLSDYDSTRSSMTFLSQHVIHNKRAISTGTNAGGWAASPLNTWLNTRFYDGIPVQVKQLIKRSNVTSSVGSKSLSLSTSQCYIYIPSVYEIASTTMDSKPYSDEATAMSYFLNNDTRIRTDLSGVASTYWTRSPYYETGTGNQGNTYYYYIQATGAPTPFITPSTEQGVLIEFSI